MRHSQAFAPAAITNFFAIYDKGVSRGDYSSYAGIGATGGGFVLSSGVYTEATFVNDSSPTKIRITVNGDPKYKAKTTRKAVEFLLKDAGLRFGSLGLNQRVEVPIGYGFGASAASALSAVLATASAARLDLSQRRVAYAAHVADIESRTGLGTVSAIYKTAGAGAILRPGGPEIAKFLRVRLPRRMSIVVASLAPFMKSRVLSSELFRKRVNELGEKALTRLKRDPEFGTLASAGERFAGELGLETPEVKSLLKIAKENGALWASQNMVGYAIHCIIGTDKAARLGGSLAASDLHPDVRYFDFGTRSSRVLSSPL